MMKFFKKISENSIYQTIIGAGILSLIATIIPNGWSTIWQLLIYKLTIPVVGVILLLCFGIIIAWLVSRINFFRTPAHQRRYTTDIIDDIRWRWEWTDDWLEIEPYCKIHDSKLHQDPGHNPRYLYCDLCEQPLMPIYTLSQLQDRAKRELERKIITGDWKKKSCINMPLNNNTDEMTNSNNALSREKY